MFEKSKEFIKKSLKSNLEVKEFISDAKNMGQKELNKKEGSAVPSSVSKAEFETRYKNINMVLYSFLVFFCLVLLVPIFNYSIMNLIVALLSCVLIGMFYSKYCFIAWRARKVYEKWDERDKSFEYSFQDFLDEAYCDPVNFIPRGLKNV